MRQHHYWIAAGVVVLAAGMGVTSLRRLENDLRRAEERSQGLPQAMRELAKELAEAKAEVRALEDELLTLEKAGAAHEQTLRKSLSTIREDLGIQGMALACRVDDQAVAIEQLEQQSRVIGGEFRQAQALEAKVAADEHWERLHEEISGLSALASGFSRDLDQLRESLERDEQVLWEDLVGPAVQLVGTSTVGSGVLLERSPTAVLENAKPIVLTAWHVVRDIFAESTESDPPLLIVMQGSSGQLRRESAHLRAHDAGLDVALLELETTADLPAGARLASRERLDNVRIFQEIYAVGCPLGNDPIPTRGEISHMHHRVDGKSYWMISAPTYIGNSGGGIFAAHSRHLLGVFSKIYTHGSLRPTIVPHMGLVTPLGRILDWVEEGTFARVVACEAAGQALTLEQR